MEAARLECLLSGALRERQRLFSTRPSYLDARARSPDKSNLAITLISSDHCACQLPRAGTHIATGPQKLEGFRVGSITIVGRSLDLEPRHAVQPLSPWVL